MLSYAVIALVVCGSAFIVKALYEDRSPPPEHEDQIDRRQLDRSLVHHLRFRIVPYLVSAELLDKQPLYRVFGFYAYAREVLAGVAGAGLLPPALNVLRQLDEASAQAPREVTASAVWGSVSPSLTVVGGVIAVCLIVLRTYFNSKEVPKRFVLARSCRGEFRVINLRINTVAAGSPDLLNALEKISNEVATIVQRHIAEQSWPFDDVAVGIDKIVDARTDAILRRIAIAGPVAASSFIQQRES